MQPLSPWVWLKSDHTFEYKGEMRRECCVEFTRYNWTYLGKARNPQEAFRNALEHMLWAECKRGDSSGPVNMHRSEDFHFAGGRN